MAHIKIIFLALLMACPLRAEETTKLNLPTLTLGFSGTTMLDVSPEDARAASQIWLEKVLTDLNEGQLGAKVQVVIYQTKEEMELTI